MKIKNIAKLILQKLDKNKEHLKNQFLSKNEKTNTKYFFIDDLLPYEFVLDAYNNFPKEISEWLYMDTFREKKYTFKELDRLDNNIVASLTDSFHDQGVIKSISEITNINDLVSDPSLYAGGISRMDYGHFLNPHVDNSHDGNRKKYRRLNLLFYVTPDLEEEDGGNLELWDTKVLKPLKIPCKFNRLVVMETNPFSYHSVDRINKDVKRCCVSNYYFSDLSPSGKDYYHVTSFLGRPNQNLRRIYGRVDNFLRNTFVKLTGFARGGRYKRN